MSLIIDTYCNTINNYLSESTGESLRTIDLPSIYFSQKPTVVLRCLDSSGEPVVFANDDVFEFSASNAFGCDNTILLLTTNDNFNLHALADQPNGIISFNVDAATEELSTYLESAELSNGKSLIRGEIKVFALGSDDPYMIFQFQFYVATLVNCDGAVPTELDSNYYTKAETDAKFLAIDDANDGFVTTDEFNNRSFVGCYRTISLSAFSFIPDDGLSTGTETTEDGNVRFDYIELPAGSDAGVTCQLCLPQTWDLGNIKAKVYFRPVSALTEESSSSSSENASAKSVVFAVSANAFSDGEDIQGTTSTPVSVTKAINGFRNVHITDATPSITIDADDTDDLIFLSVMRDADHPSDTANAVRFYGIKIQYLEDGSANPESW